MRVAVLHNYRDEQQPSMRLYAERLGEALMRRRVTVTRVRPPGVVPDAWRARSQAWAKLDGYIGRFAIYPRLVRNIPGDILHIVDHGQGYLLASIDSRRTVVTCHDVILLALAAGRIGSTPVPQLALELFRVSVELMKRAAAIVAVSEQTKRDLVTFADVDPARITVVYSGLNQPFSPDPARGAAFRARHNLGSGPLILQLGRTFYKNVPGTLRVLRRLRSSGVDARLVRTGRPLAGAERRLAETIDVIDHVVELGGVADEEIPALYNAVDLLLFPSLYEGFGWPPLEAMASGTPVVCSNGGALQEIVQDAALTADPEDVEALAWHAGAALTDAPLRDGLIARGVAHAARFTWDDTARNMLAVYQTVLERAA